LEKCENFIHNTMQWLTGDRQPQI